MNDSQSAFRNVSREQAPRKCSTRQSWPQFPVTLERLKTYPIGQHPWLAPRIDLEEHADYLECP